MNFFLLKLEFHLFAVPVDARYKLSIARSGCPIIQYDEEKIIKMVKDYILENMVEDVVIDLSDSSLAKNQWNLQQMIILKSKHMVMWDSFLSYFDLSSFANKKTLNYGPETTKRAR